MSFKLALSAGHYLYTAGKRCLKSLDVTETREWWLNDRIADRLELLLSDYEGIEILRLDDTSGKKEISLSKRASKSDMWNADLYLAIHHNAGIKGGTGGGIVAYCYSGTVPQNTIDWQKSFYNELIRLTGLKGNRANGCARANLFECREPKADSVLLELGFMDSKTDVPIILTQEYANKCAQACCNVIVKKAKLSKKAYTVSKIDTYKVIANLNKYSSAVDAIKQINSKGTYKTGTYYLFNKYPNGISGMYNITTDRTGNTAGAWINPAENKINNKLYRVRKSKNDAKTQKGAYSNLENAKAACKKAGKGYHVFDSDYTIVYSNT